MKKVLQINVSFNQPELLEKMVEQLAHRHMYLGYDKANTGSNWVPIETSSTETFTAGTVSLEEKDADTVNEPFITQFLFTCSKEQYTGYKVQWSTSLN